MKKNKDIILILVIGFLLWFLAMLAVGCKPMEHDHYIYCDTLPVVFDVGSLDIQINSWSTDTMIYR